MHIGAHRRAARATLATVAVAFALPLVLVVLPLSGAHFFGLDQTRIDLAMGCLAERFSLWRDGWLLAWVGNGTPALDAMFGLTYPPRWLFSVFSPDAAGSALVIFHLALWSGGVALLARSFHLRPSSSVAAGLFVAGSGTALNAGEHSLYLFATAWLPWAWAGARLALRDAGPLPRALVVLALAGTLHSGDPQSFCIGGALIAMECALCVWRDRSTARRALLVFSLVLLAFGVVVVVWLPTLLEMRLTPRSSGLSLHDALRWSFEARAALGALWPNLWTTTVAPHTTLWNLTTTGHDARPWNLTPYFGVVVLVAGVAGAFERRTRVATCVAAVAVLAALGDETPFLPLAMRVVPGVALFRYPEKYLPIATVAWVIVASGALEGWGRSRLRRRRFAWAALPATLLLLAGVGAAWAVGDVVDGWAQESSALPASPDQPTASLVVLHAALQPVVALLAAWATLFYARRRVLLVALLDVVVAGAALAQVGPSLRDARTALEPFGRADTHLVPVLCVDPLLEATVVVNAQVGGPWAQALFARQWDCSELQTCDGLASPLPYSSMMTRTQRLLRLRMSAAPLIAATAFGCDLFASSQDLDLPRLPLQTAAGPVDTIYGVHVFATDTGLPSVFVVAEPRLVADEAALLAEIWAAPSSARVRSLVEDPRQEVALLPVGRDARVDVDWPRRDRATLRAAGAGGAVVGLNTAYLFGWSAMQAGRRLSTLRIAGQHLGVVIDDVTAGPIELVYAPPCFALGAAVSAGSLLGALYVIFFVQRRRQRR